MKNLSLVLAVILLLGFTWASMTREYILHGWYGLGMHCANKNFSEISILPPYNNV